LAPLRVANKTFQQLWVMVDGIYPELSRFVKTMSVPLTKAERMYSKWQESSRKSVERAFGILRRKFQFLARPVELWFEDDIRNAVNTCIILHNMMVETRISRDEEENIDWYNYLVDGDEQFDVPLMGGGGQQQQALVNPPVLSLQGKLAQVRMQWPDEYTDADKANSIKEAINEHFADSKEEWDGLYNRTAHYALRDAIVEDLMKQKNNK
jgi:Plant transposon protein